MIIGFYSLTPIFSRHKGTQTFPPLRNTHGRINHGNHTVSTQCTDQCRFDSLWTRTYNSHRSIFRPCLCLYARCSRARGNGKVLHAIRSVFIGRCWNVITGLRKTFTPPKHDQRSRDSDKTPRSLKSGVVLIPKKWAQPREWFAPI